ncbi:hypothetical protein N7468_008811 [Penicillium chermesinum]|uniref:Calcineurin-like phosphoesterase domain-containing protein n=1 Tax=Penicillium chermesinum TaxID=63820 RepID=A0A9W9NGQ7_9EURO|nr:uncharacterized protein N7468_008811 [Penicillium chermesinum]KAJ5219607.1 hypothetical protein N7468_008811 [Penicillium chermesinum]KAJ6153618.1 hypothetical protein N7470_006577 [Penicillium chermesinum]
MSSPFHRRPISDYFISSPLVALLYPLHQALLRLRGSPRLPPPAAHPISVVCISDTHTQKWPDVPDGDLLIHAGDLANDGSVREIQAAVDWLRSLPHKHKVVICGNHDGYFDPRSRLEEDRDETPNGSFVGVSASTASIHEIDDRNGSRIDWGDIHYLQHSAVTLEFNPPDTTSVSDAKTPLTHAHPRLLTVYGAPQIPAIVPMGPEHAFTYPPKFDAWSGTVPQETDILVTHTPPQAHLDLSPVYSTGCPNLLNEAWRVRPLLHVFGHIHESAGREPVFWDEAQRAWERLCAARRVRARYSRVVALGGFFRDLFDPSGWVDAARVIVYGVLGVIWAQIWGGESPGGGWMVNAACMYRGSGKLGNPPQVIVL